MDTTSIIQIELLIFSKNQQNRVINIDISAQAFDSLLVEKTKFSTQLINKTSTKDKNKLMNEYKPLI
jgi:hypothetical protein